MARQTRGIRNANPAGAEDLLPGLLDLFVLSALARERSHWRAISLWIRTTTKNTFDVKVGSLRPALDRLEGRGLLTMKWDKTRNGRNAHFYSITAKGRDALYLEKQWWKRISTAVTTAIEITPPDVS